MTRKHYVLLAEIVKDLPNDRELIADRLADVLADDNPNFDRERFIMACGVAA